jgi:hypothetical protein
MTGNNQFKNFKDKPVVETVKLAMECYPDDNRIAAQSIGMSDKSYRYIKKALTLRNNNGLPTELKEKIDEAMATIDEKKGMADAQRMLAFAGIMFPEPCVQSKIYRTIESAEQRAELVAKSEQLRIERSQMRAVKSSLSRADRIAESRKKYEAKRRHKAQEPKRQKRLDQTLIHIRESCESTRDMEMPTRLDDAEIRKAVATLSVSIELIGQLMKRLLGEGDDDDHINGKG